MQGRCACGCQVRHCRRVPTVFSHWERGTPAWALGVVGTNKKISNSDKSNYPVYRVIFEHNNVLMSIHEKTYGYIASKHRQNTKHAKKLAFPNRRLAFSSGRRLSCTHLGAREVPRKTRGFKRSMSMQSCV